MYRLLERMIKRKNYKSKEEMRNKIDVFFAVEPARITEEEYKKLNELLNKNTEIKGV